MNTIDTVDYYRLTVKNGMYEYDGKLKPFETETKTLKIKQPDGLMKEEKLEIRRSIQGPVVWDSNGVTVAMRVAGLDRPKMLEQWFKMGEAHNFEEFKSAMKMMQIPMWNCDYVDADGHLMLFFAGLMPRRPKGDYAYWAKVVPGDTSETMWDDYLTFDELPKSIDPASGWNQNTNEPPWTYTFPQLDRLKFAPYVAPTGLDMPTMRTLRSLRLITQDKPTSYDQLVTNLHSTRMELADKVLPDLLKAAGDSEAAKVLAAWDHQTEVNSKGAVLFQAFADKYFTGNNGIAPKLRVPYDPARPLETAYGLKDPAGAVAALNAAAEDVRQTYGTLDVKWGDVTVTAAAQPTCQAMAVRVPWASSRTIAFSQKEGKKNFAAHGETIVCAVEFAANQRANCLLGYGNSSRPGSRIWATSCSSCQTRYCFRCCASGKMSRRIWRSGKASEWWIFDALPADAAACGPICYTRSPPSAWPTDFCLSFRARRRLPACCRCCFRIRTTMPLLRKPMGRWWGAMSSMSGRKWRALDRSPWILKRRTRALGAC